MTAPASITPVDLAELPASLIDAATRCCVEIHNDPPEAVAAMLADLAEYPPDSWPWLTSHFQAQLPPLVITDTAATCGACQHSRPTQHPAILDCAAGVLSGLPIAGRWHTDRHDCERFTVQATGAVRRTVVKTRDKTPTTTRDPSYDPFTQ